MASTQSDSDLSICAIFEMRYAISKSQLSDLNLILTLTLTPSLTLILTQNHCGVKMSRSSKVKWFKICAFCRLHRHAGSVQHIVSQTIIVFWHGSTACPTLIAENWTSQPHMITYGIEIDT